MAVNELMHPRNRYRKKPNFQELIKVYPELNDVAKVDLAGKVKLDYKNKQAVHLLSKCLLLRDFGLKVELPPDKLVPTLPLRLNYIHWLEDIGVLAQWHEKEIVRGIDIGCGASCIYPLLAAVQSERRWHMVAIEKAADSFQSARDNVANNDLQHCIDVRLQTADAETILLQVLEKLPNQRFDFCMCNPPFFDSATTHRGPQNRTGKRREPSNASTGLAEELSTDGGEVKFINDIIQESIQMKDRVALYTTMIGQKRSLEQIVQILKSASIHNFTVNRFCQGNTTRWAIAWSFDTRIMLSFVPTTENGVDKGSSPGKRKPVGKPVCSKMFTTNEMDSIEAAKQYIVGQLNIIAVDVRTVCVENSKEIFCTLIARQNTWSHQRCKRRAEQSKRNANGNETSETIGTEEHLKNGDCTKKPRLQEEDCSRLDEGPTNQPYLRAAIKVEQKTDGYYVALQYMEGSAGKDAVNQILQYLKNTAKNKLTKES